MKISVAVTCYNGMRYIGEQLSSLLSQTVSADEVIISDDASKDGTAEIVSRFIRENGLAHWRLLINGQNLGYIQNYRRVFAAATGEIVALCDQDDIWENTKLETFQRFFSEHPDAAAVNTGVVLIDGNGRPLNRPLSDLSPLMQQIVLHTPKGKAARISRTKRSFFPLVQQNIAPGCTMCVRRRLISRYLAEGESAIPHDWELNMMACSENGLYFLNLPLTRYRLHGGNTIGLSADKRAAYDSFLEKRRAEHQFIGVRLRLALRYYGYQDRMANGINDLYNARGRFLEHPSLINRIRIERHPLLYARLLPLRSRAGDLYAALGLHRLWLPGKREDK